MGLMNESAAHPVDTAITAVETALAGVVDTPTWSMSTEVLAADLARLSQVAARVAELELRLVAQAEHSGVAGDRGAASTYAMWSTTTHQTRPTTKRRQKLATALDGARWLTREAMGRGEVTEAQAHVIVASIEALGDLPEEIAARVDAHVLEVAEKDLLRLAYDHDPRELRVLGRHILDVVAPELGDAAERAALDKDERDAAAAARFTMSDDGHGQTHGRFTIPATHAAMLRIMLQAVWHPTMGDGPRGQGKAFMDLIERYPTDHLPEHGGLAATIVVTMTADQLTDDLTAAGVCETSTGTRISAGEARRLACGAGIIPAVLGEKSAVLDVGRAARFHNKTQRVAIALRDKTCTAEGCDYPPGLCHHHHDDPWATGGNTSVTNGRLLCPQHHRMIHSPHYAASPSKHGRLTIRRT